jgi:hypothetical protein
MILTAESIQAAREWFAANQLAQIADVESGAVRVNNPAVYFADCRRESADFLAGKHDSGFAFRQRAYYIQTGDCPALFPKAPK